MKIEELKQYIATGRQDNRKFVIIVYDLVEKDYYPHYFDHDDVDFEWSKFISESKMKPMVSFNLNKFIYGID